MIPVKLTIHNFMPYRDNVPPLYFSGIHTASIWGENGNGKSAIIDAITWALWGKTRARSDDDLIHMGQTETQVEFDFTVGQQFYRVIRKHARPKSRKSSGRSSLDLLVDSNGGFKVISGDGIRQTEQKIRDILHMDYDTFVNSAFLRQGHADEFTRQTPVKRKEVLGNILGLSFYDRLEEQAKEKARQLEGDISLGENIIKEINDELISKPDYEAEFVKVQGELSQIEEVMQKQESRLTELRQKKESLENKKIQLTQLDEHTTETTRTLAHLDEQLRQHNSRIKEYSELIGRRVSIEEGYTRFIEVKKLNNELNQKLALINKLNQRKYELDMAIERGQAALITEHRLAESKISELENRYQKLPQLKNELQQVQAEIQKLSGEDELLSLKKNASQELRNNLYIIESGKARAEKEIADIEEKLHLLFTEKGAKCPLCETELGTEGLKLIEVKYTTDRDNKSSSIEENQVELAKKRLHLDSLEKEISSLETRLSQNKTALQSKLSLLGREISEAEKAGSQLKEERTGLNDIEEHLAAKDFAAEEQEALVKLEIQLSQIGYKPEQHEQIRRQLTELEQYENPKRKLDEADRLIEQEKESASRAEQTARELRNSLEADTRKKKELIIELGSLRQISDELRRAEDEHKSSGEQQKQIQQSVGIISGKLQRFSELEQKKKEKQKLLTQSSKEEKIYRDLAQAFGKKGIQALLIEIALPEIENEANNLLARMTDNRMHVKIETQRETKKGDLQETLDINISDELGTRNYEMFSGGEAFRIDFAIRIALSRLLARRAGAPLPTLIIDEGFGTQDSTGLEKLKEAITSIQDTFDKILVITHIEDFRDAFPVRIDVMKTGKGSTIEVNN